MTLLYLNSRITHYLQRITAQITGQITGSRDYGLWAKRLWTTQVLYCFSPLPLPLIASQPHGSHDLVGKKLEISKRMCNLDFSENTLKECVILVTTLPIKKNNFSFRHRPKLCVKGRRRVIRNVF